MNRELFLCQLGNRLAQLPAEEVEKQLAYYNEMIEDMKEDGISEEEAVESFGNVDEIAKGIMQEVPMSALVKNRITPKKGWTPTAIILAVLGAPLWVPLAGSAVGVIASVYVTVWAVIATVFAAVISLGAAGVGLFIIAFTMTSYGAGYVLLTLGTGLVLLGLCILGFFAGKVISVKLIQLTKWVWRKTKSLFIKKPAVNMEMEAA